MSVRSSEALTVRVTATSCSTPGAVHCVSAAAGSTNSPASAVQAKVTPSSRLVVAPRVIVSPGSTTVWL